MSLLLLLLDAIDLLIHLLAVLLTAMYSLITYLFSLIFPLFYNQIVQQYEDQQNLRVHRNYQQLFVTFCFLSVAVRCAAFAGALYTGNRSWQEAELFLAFMNRRGSVDFNVYICFAALFTFLAYGHYLLYFSSACRQNWTFLYDLLVRNEAQFREQFGPMLLRELFNVEQLKELKEYQRAVAKLAKDAVLLVVTLWAVADDDPKWSFKGRLRYFSFLGTRCRVRAIMCLLVCEVVISVAIFVIGEWW